MNLPVGPWSERFRGCPCQGRRLRCPQNWVKAPQGRQGGIRFLRHLLRGLHTGRIEHELVLSLFWGQNLKSGCLGLCSLEGVLGQDSSCFVIF